MPGSGETAPAAAPARAKVYDCFTFFNELDLLELRLHEMSASVDAFVLAEAPVTFRGAGKPLLYALNEARFAAFRGKIRHVVVDDMPETDDPWARERHQRNCLTRGLDDAAPGDLVMISDVDEILRAEAIREAARRAAFCYFTQDLFYFYANWRATSPRARLWSKAFAAPYDAIRAMPDLSAPREQSAAAYLAAQGLDPCRGIVDHAGWHFSWTGGVQRLMTKMDAFSHDEGAMQAWNDRDALAAAIGSQRFFYDGEALENLAVTHGFPLHMQRNQQAYRQIGLVSPNSAEGVPFYEPPREVVFAQLAELQAAARRNAGRHDADEEEIARLQAANRQLQAELDAVRASTSWRITAPVRVAGDLIRRRSGGGSGSP